MTPQCNIVCSKLQSKEEKRRFSMAMHNPLTQYHMWKYQLQGREEFTTVAHNPHALYHKHGSVQQQRREESFYGYRLSPVAVP